jgi:hypothetical protein
MESYNTYDGAAHVKNETPNPKMKRPSRNCGTLADVEIMAVPRQMMKPTMPFRLREGQVGYRLNMYTSPKHATTTAVLVAEERVRKT